MRFLPLLSSTPLAHELLTVQAWTIFSQNWRELGSLVVIGWAFLNLVKALPWMYFVIVTVIIEASDLSNTRLPQDPDSYIDMLSGK